MGNFTMKETRLADLYKIDLVNHTSKSLDDTIMGMIETRHKAVSEKHIYR